MASSPSIPLENGLNLNECMSSGSILEINTLYEDNVDIEDEGNDKYYDTFGKPIESFDRFETSLNTVDEQGFVKKKILEKGGGEPLHEGCTVNIVYSAYWENEKEPYDIRTPIKPLVIDMNDNGVLPGIQIAVMSMLVGEFSLFLLSYQVMYGILGVPPKIKPKAKCVFYIKLVKSQLTPKDGHLDMTAENVFDRVHKEVRNLYMNGVNLHNVCNYAAAARLFRQAVHKLHICRLADDKEQETQEKLLIKLYMNLAVCYNKIGKPLQTCIACNELNNLRNIWHNGKALYQNAKALRMISEYDRAEKKLKRAIQLCPDNKDMLAESKLLTTLRDGKNKSMLNLEKCDEEIAKEVSDMFKREVDNLIVMFKADAESQDISLPSDLNEAEEAYVREACQRENVSCNKIQKKSPLEVVPNKFSEF